MAKKSPADPTAEKPKVTKQSLTTRWTPDQARKIRQTADTAGLHVIAFAQKAIADAAGVDWSPSERGSFGNGDD